jgi:hypothetical protein
VPVPVHGRMYVFNWGSDASFSVPAATPREVQRHRAHGPIGYEASGKSALDRCGGTLIPFEFLAPRYLPGTGVHPSTGAWASLG